MKNTWKSYELFMKLSLESFNPRTLTKHLFDFYVQMHFLMFDSKPEWNYQFEFKKNNEWFQDQADATTKNPPRGSDEKNIPFLSISNKVETFYFHTENLTSFSIYKKTNLSCN